MFAVLVFSDRSLLWGVCLLEVWKLYRKVFFFCVKFVLQSVGVLRRKLS